MRLWMLLPLLLGSACADKQNVTSMGRFGGAPPSLIVSSDVRTAAGDTLGVATFSQEPDGVWVSLESRGLPQGQYGVQLHASGRCEGPDFASAGPAGLPGGPLPDLDIAANGKGRMTALVPGLQLKGGAAPLLGPGGTAITIRAAGAADRIACGVISAGTRSSS